jgi:predicted O-methyltransferase YrrM
LSVPGKNRTVESTQASVLHILRHPYLWSTFPRRVRRLRERAAVADWINFAYRSPFAPIQIRVEITTFIETVAARRPQAVLEIGTASGGTLLLLMLASAPDATVIRVDLPGVERFGGRYPLWKRLYFQRFALPSQRLHLLCADSHAPATLQGVRSILRNRKLDLLFIDGDHTYDGVRADWEMYAPLVAPDGLVAFHDILPQPPESGCEVSVFWQELKEKFEHREIVAGSGLSWGIGIIWPERPV